MEVQLKLRGEGYTREKEVGALAEPLSGGTAEVKGGKGYTRGRKVGALAEPVSGGTAEVKGGKGYTRGRRGWSVS